MFGSPKMFCQFHAQKVLRRSQRTLVGTFNVFLCLGHVNLSHRKSSPSNTCHEKRFSASCLDLQGCFASFMPKKVHRRTQRTFVGTFNMFLSLGHVNLSHRKSSTTKTCQEKRSLPHDWISKDDLSVSCPQRSSGGLKGHLWALSMCFCALDLSICSTKTVLQPKLVR